MAPPRQLHWAPFMLLMLLLVAAPSGGDATDADVLLKFKSSLSNADAPLNNWNASIRPPCNGSFSNWAGIICDDGGNVLGLRLENMSLAGIIDVDTLVGLRTLRSLSFMNNSFEGPMPEVNKLGAIRVLYLSLNRFSGEILDDAFQGMNSLRKVHLARNQFTGKIPSSLVALTRLMELSLEGNQFEGNIPDFAQRKWTLFNLANNHLDGRIPTTLSNLNSSSFLGNKDLCGKPLGPCKNSKMKGYIVIIAILVVAVAALGAIGACLFIRGRRTQTYEYGMATQTYEYGMASQKEGRPHKNFAANNVAGQKKGQSTDEYRKGENGKLYFVRNDRDTFDLQDLLRAGAEVLGSGSFGSSYKAVLLSGPAVVVKRFRQMNNMGKEQFYDHMTRLGRLSHPNLLPLVAFYFTKEEKLLISDFAENGSLASHLHANRAPGQPGLDWPTRLKIIKGVARGLACLYREFPGLTLPHGHLKSSNVLLDHTFRPLLSEYCLVPAVNKEHAQQYMAAYKSPELAQLDRTTKKTDVWCLGILILELLTGRFPANYLRHGRGENEDLATWVNSVVREEWTGEVFDIDMKGIKDSEEEMLKLLKIGMCCCECNVGRRWELREALEKIEELKERDPEEGYYSSCASEGDIYSSRAMTEEDFSFLS